MRHFYVFVCLFICHVLHGQATFQKPLVVGWDGASPKSVLELSDGYLMVSWGNTEYSGTLAYRAGIFFQRTDLSGNLLWTKIFNNPGKTYSVGNYGSLYPVEDGYLISGNERDSVTRDYDFVLLKFDTAANLRWMKKYPRSGTQVNWHGSLTNDGGYVLIGETFLSQPPADYLVVKTDSSGNLLWLKTYGGSDDDIGRKIHQTPDGGFIFSGTSKSFGHGGYDLWLIKSDSLGNIQWDKTYGTFLDDRLRYVSLSKTGYVVWGGLDTTIYNTEYPYAAVAMKLNENGEVLWRTFFRHQKRLIIWQLRELEDGNIVAIGEQQIGTYTDSITAWIEKLNSSGDVLWERFHFGPVSEDAYWGPATFFTGDFQQTKDAGFIIAGEAEKSDSIAPNIFFLQPWLVKLDSNGCFGPSNCGLPVGIEEIQLNKDVTILSFPNPFTTQALISIKANSGEFTNEKIQFRLFDISGKLLQINNYTLNQYGYCEFYVKREHYPAGIYFYRVTTQKAVLGKGKLIAR